MDKPQNLDPKTLYTEIQGEVQKVLIGNEEIVAHLTVSLLTRGHVLLEGIPGVAKTTIASLFSKATGLSSNRIQMTPDLLPADITGNYVYRQKAGKFELIKGPVFSNVVVADEINRATPKTQSALLEAMQENHTTIEGDTYELPEPFMVIATQNPIEMEGTFNLPEAQRDRFQFKLDVELLGEDDEINLLKRFDEVPNLTPDSIERVIPQGAIASARKTVSEVYVDDKVVEYIRTIVNLTREHPHIKYGSSPRGSLTLLNTSKARAAIAGRDYVIPDDVKKLAPSALKHRIVLDTEAEMSNRTSEEIIDSVLSEVRAPDLPKEGAK
ncbi:MAG: AAA family ATPase [Halobacteria archaeon]